MSAVNRPTDTKVKEKVDTHPRNLIQIAYIDSLTGH